MSVTRENKKAEAIKRMKTLGLFAPCIDAFEKHDEVQLSEMTGGLYEFSSDAELTAKYEEKYQHFKTLYPTVKALY